MLKITITVSCAYTRTRSALWACLLQFRAFTRELTADASSFVCDRDAVARYMTGVGELQDLLCDRQVIDSIEYELMDGYVTPFYAVEVVSLMLYCMLTPPPVVCGRVRCF